MLTLGKLIAIGYLTFGRTFAYLGFAPIFPAEAYLGLCLVANPVGWVHNLRNYVGKASIVWFLIFLFWGLVEVGRGLAANRDLLNTLRGLAAHYYPLLFLVGAGMASRTSLHGFVRFISFASFCVALNGLAYALLFSRIHWVLPWATKVPLFGGPAMPAFTCLGLIALLPYQRTSVYWIGLLNLLAILANPGRASWLSFVVGTLIILLCERRLSLVFRIAGAFIVLELLVFYLGPWLPTAEGRGGTVSITSLLGRLIATFDPNLAYKMISSLGGDLRDATLISSVVGTTSWRAEFWTRVIGSLGSTEQRLMGHGYGFPLGAMVGFGVDLFTPHNFSIYLIGYTGLIGALIFVGLFISLLRSFQVLPRSPLRTFLVSQLIATLVLALFGNAMETPFVAAPFYWTLGLAYGLARELALEVESEIQG
jgi:hypothetical protein